MEQQDTSPGGIIRSGMEFLTWRIIELSFSAAPQPRVIMYTQNPEDRWDISLGFADVQHLMEDNLYITFLKASMSLKAPAEDMRPAGDNTPTDQTILDANAVIMGIFRIVGDGISDADRDNLLLRQTPAILLPFLRGALGSLMAAAGFGVEVLPLINIYDMLKDKKDIRIVECPANPAQ